MSSLVPSLTPSELKSILRARGFEIYRTTPEEVILAERVRDNLLMDSSVAVRLGENAAVRVVIRAEGADFPGEPPESLLARARAAAEPAVQRGYRECTTRVCPVHDPGDPARVLDTWYEISLERPVTDATELEDELRAALALEKAARPQR
jgi:hypothetical protein